MRGTDWKLKNWGEICEIIMIIIDGNVIIRKNRKPEGKEWGQLIGNENYKTRGNMPNKGK